MRQQCPVDTSIFKFLVAVYSHVPDTCSFKGRPVKFTSLGIAQDGEFETNAYWEAQQSIVWSPFFFLCEGNQLFQLNARFIVWKQQSTIIIDILVVVLEVYFFGEQ